MKQNIREAEILRVIKENQSISRLELAKKFDLTPARISKIIKSLLEKKIVLEKNIGKSTGGRPPIHLSINENIFGDILGIHLGPKDIFFFTRKYYRKNKREKKIFIKR